MTSLTQTTALFANLKRTVEPQTWPVSLVELKSELRIEHDEENGDLLRYIKAATTKVENDTRRGFVTQTWKQYLDSFCDYLILLRRCPVIAVSSITYVDTSGVTQTISSADYQVDVASEPARIYPAYGETWPTVRTSALNPITITFTVGYTADTPELLLARHAILIAARAMYQRCEEPGMAYDSLIQALRWD